MASSLINPRSTRAPVISRRLAPYLFISPFFLLFLVFGVFPTFYGLFMSLTKTKLTDLNSMPWNGLENYQYTLLRDPWFWRAVWNTLVLGVFGLLIQPIALLLAFTIHHRLKRFRSLVTGLYFLPYITSTVAIALIFSMVFSKNVGLLNMVIGTFKSVPLIGSLLPPENIDWLGNPDTIKPAIALVVLWKYLGWNVLLFLSRLQAIPTELYEAAAIDGANTSQQFWKITLPQLRGMIFFNITLTIIGQMQLFEEPYILVGGEGGADQSGLTVATYLFTTMIQYRDAGTAAAMGWIIFAMMLLLTFVNNKLFGAEARARGE
jgi:multiple sugar transport system permease protein